jgi:hypothetical protein
VSPSSLLEPGTAFLSSALEVESVKVLELERLAHVSLVVGLTLCNVLCADFLVFLRRQTGRDVGLSRLDASYFKLSRKRPMKCVQFVVVTHSHGEITHAKYPK